MSPLICSREQQLKYPQSLTVFRIRGRRTRYNTLLGIDYDCYFFLKRDGHNTPVLARTDSFSLRKYCQPSVVFIFSLQRIFWYQQFTQYDVEEIFHVS